MTKHFLTAALTCVSLASFAQDAVGPPDALVADGLPPIPKSVAESVGRYTEFRGAVFRSWHPTRREMLVRTRFAETGQIHRLKMPGGARSQVTFFPDSVSGASYQPTAGDYFLFTKDVGGNEFNQIYRYDLSTGQHTLLTDGKSRNSGGLWNKKGDRVVYTSSRRNRKDADFYVMDPADPRSDKMVSQSDGPGWGAIDWSPDGATFLIGKFVSANESHLYLMDAGTGERTRLTPDEKGVHWGGGQFAADGKGVYVTTDRAGEFSQLAYVDLATKAITILTPDLKWDVEDLDLSHDGKWLAYVTNEDGLSVLHLMDTATRKEFGPPSFPAGQISALKWHKNNKDLALTLTSARSPSDVYSLDMETRKIDRWTESETGGLVTSNFVEPELIRWKSFDDRQISGFLYKPDPAKFPGKRPVIINIHGGPESQFRPGFMSSYNYYFNELGVAVIFPNVRGSSGYGKTFLTLDNGKLREDSVKDIGALLDHVATRPELDSQRVMITGGSYGGYMTLACSVHFADRIRCAVDVVGISNFVTFLEKTEPYRQDLRRVEYGDERDPAMREWMTQIAPLTNVAKIKKPLFIVQGANDPRVPKQEADQMAAALKAQGTPVWYLLGKDEGHGFAKKKNFEFQFYATVEFVKRHLLGDGAPAADPKSGH
ncbi:MAG TPA: S9 family peptidase [Tepidisphaeraceae bacterium]|nr:S9 family peptidase [Tepidisphaeraceae bacterium]